MALSSWPFENADTSETQYSYLFRELQDPGVVGQSGDAALQVTVGSGLAVSVLPGRAFARGYMLAADTPEALPLSTAHGTLTRTDRIVVRFDPLANTGTLAVLEGAPGSGAPALTQTDTLTFEVSLARVTVPAGATTLSASNIVDERAWLGRRVGEWSSATRPTSPARGRLGFNHSTGVFEFWDGSKWRDLLPALTWASISGKPTTSTLDGRTLHVGTAAPSASLGVDGDIYFQAV